MRYRRSLFGKSRPRRFSVIHLNQKRHCSDTHLKKQQQQKKRKRKTKSRIEATFEKLNAKSVFVFVSLPVAFLRTFTSVESMKNKQQKKIIYFLAWISFAFAFAFGLVGFFFILFAFVYSSFRPSPLHMHGFSCVYKRNIANIFPIFFSFLFWTNFFIFLYIFLLFLLLFPLYISNKYLCSALISLYFFGFFCFCFQMFFGFRFFQFMFFFWYSCNELKWMYTCVSFQRNKRIVNAAQYEKPMSAEHCILSDS